MRYSIPGVGTNVPFPHISNAILSKDGHTWICRISYDEKEGAWLIVHPDERRGLRVFLNDKPGPNDNYIRVTAIQSSGKAAWADPVTLTPGGRYS